MNKSNLVGDIVTDYTASYAKYVATSRAIPSLMDGLKPVARRCINSADDLKIYHDKKFLKVAKLEGQVMGDYHPHGGASMVQLAQPFKTRYPLFDGQGNFGCADLPNSVAASRYIETKLSKFCEDFYLKDAEFADIDDNYDGRLKEKVLYYPDLPGVMFTGASGIAVGLSTSIPIHTITDVANSLLLYIKNNYNNTDSNEEYISVLMPETCEKSIIATDKVEIASMYKNGEGSIVYKAATHRETIDGVPALVVDAFPPDYSKKRLDNSIILDAVENNMLTLLNESSVNVRYVFISSDSNLLDTIENKLDTRISYRFYIEHRGVIKKYKLAEIYDTFIVEKLGFIDRKYKVLLAKVENQLKYYEALLKFRSGNYAKKVISMDEQDAISYLSTELRIDKTVASSILSSTIRELLSSNLDNINRKLSDLRDKKLNYESFIANPLNKLINDIEVLKSNYLGEVRNAVHISDIIDKVDIDTQLGHMSINKTSRYLVATKDNNIICVYGSDLVSDAAVSTKLVISAEYNYYLLVAPKGFIVMRLEDIISKGSKLNSGVLANILGFNNLKNSIVYMTSDSRRKYSIALDDTFLRTRLSIIYPDRVVTGASFSFA